MQQQESPGGCRAIGRDPPAVELENTGLGRVKPDLVILQANRVWSSRNGAGWFEHQLPLPLPEKQAEGGVYAECRQEQRRSQASEKPACAGQRLLWGERIFPSGWRGVLVFSQRRVRQPIPAEYHRCGTEPQSSR